MSSEHRYVTIDDIINSVEQPFSIIEEFSNLTPRRKVMLCEQLFTQSHSIFLKTVKILWPRASLKDVRKLERFLQILKSAAH